MNSYTSENMLMIHKPKCENIDITTTRTSLESHNQWKDHFKKKPINFGKYADFEADNAINFSSIGNETTIIYKQNPVLYGYQKESKWEDGLKSVF